MNVRILMVGNNEDHLLPEAEMLKQRGLQVYTSSEDCIADMIDEIKPDVVYFNPEEPGVHSTHVYHDLLNDMKHVSVPVIYTLVEDDTYIVNRKRTSSRDKRSVITDNIVDGIKAALLTTGYRKRRNTINITPVNYFPYYATGA